MGKARIVYSSDQQSCFPDAAKNDVFAVIGPFNSFGDKADLQAAIEAEVRHYNRTESPPIDGTGWAEAAFAEPDDKPKGWPKHISWPPKPAPPMDWSGPPTQNCFSQNALNSYRDSIERAAANALNRETGA